MTPRRRAFLTAGVAALASSACELTDVQIAESEDQLLVEAYVSWAPPAPRAAARTSVMVMAVIGCNTK